PQRRAGHALLHHAAPAARGYFGHGNPPARRARRIGALLRAGESARAHRATRSLQKGGGVIVTGEQLAVLCAQFADNKKAENIIALDLRGISSFTDFFVICSGTSEPHLKAIAGEIQERLKKDQNVVAHAVDGYPMSQWIVIDY